MADDRTKEYEILRALTPEQKIAAMQGLLQLAYEYYAQSSSERHLRTSP